MRTDVTEWRDIATAPMDGTGILVQDGGFIITAFYRSGSWWGQIVGRQFKIKPTLWMHKSEDIKP